MPQYVYRAITKEGVIVRNKVESPSKQILIKKLKNGDLLPIDIVQVGYGLSKSNAVKKKNVVDIDEILKNANSATINQGQSKERSPYEKLSMALSVKQKVTIKDVKIFTQNFYLLKKADFNNIHALNTIIQSTENFTFKGILEDILAGVESGEYMYTTMEYYSNIFPYIYINMIKVGELSGSLTQSLEQAVKYLDSSTDISRKLRHIIIPNVIQFVVLIALLFVGTLYTVPTIQNVYDEVGTTDKLPAITVGFANFLQGVVKYWYIPVALIFATIFAISSYHSTPKGKYSHDLFKYKMPIFGKLNYSIDFSRFMKAMNLNIENGMRIQDALDVSKNVVNNYVMRGLIETSINNILVGNSWIEPFEKAGLGSPMITEMLRVGMQTDLSEMMKKLLNYMEIDINNTMTNIIAILPELTYSIVGILLIFVVLVVLVPCIQVYMGNFLFSAAGV